MPYRRSIVAVVGAVLALVMASPALAGTGMPTVIQPPASSAQTGMTYGQLSALWWQTMLNIPTPINPENGSYSEGQGTGTVQCQGGNTSQFFFLAGSQASSDSSAPVMRSCTVPANKPIFFPIINAECSDFEGLGDTDAARALCAKTLIDGVTPDSVKVTLDGRNVPNLGRRFRAASPPFDFTVPADNITGVTGPGSGTSASDGFYVFLKPLHPGNHVIHFEALDPVVGFNQFVTYILTVQ